MVKYQFIGLRCQRHLFCSHDCLNIQRLDKVLWKNHRSDNFLAKNCLNKYIIYGYNDICEKKKKYICHRHRSFNQILNSTCLYAIRWGTFFCKRQRSWISDYSIIYEKEINLKRMQVLSLLISSNWYLQFFHNLFIMKKKYTIFFVSNYYLCL